MHAGELIADRFELESIAGAGGMGEVWRAKDRHTGAPAALKVMGPSRSENAETAEVELQRFARETRALRELSHPGIVRYLADGVTGAGEPWLAMEWLEGETLNAKLRRGALEPAVAIDVTIGVAEALGHAHAHGLVHRDLKPGNIMLIGGDPAHVKLLDFGVVRSTVGASVPELTRAGMLVGTPTYMAPEQVRGDPNLDPRADVFSLGCLLFKCLTGVAAFSSQDLVAVLAKVLFEEPPRVASLLGVPAELDDLVARMLSKDRAQRPRDGSAVASALRAIGPFEAQPLRADAQPETTKLALDRERHWLCVLAIGATPDEMASSLGHDDQTHATPSLPLARVAEASGARLEVLGRNGRVLMWEGVDGPAEIAARAARVALSFSRSLAGVPMGLASGRADVGGAVPVGEALDRAAACLRRSKGQVVVDDAVMQLLEPLFEVSRSGNVAVLVGERAREGTARTLLGKPTACVGREVELSTLSLTFDAMQDDETAMPVILTGDAGVGKSRIRHEWLRLLRASHPEAQIWSAQGDVMSQGATFGVAAALVADACGVGLGTPRDEVRQKISARVAAHVAGPDQKRVASRLCEMCGAGWETDVDEALQNARREPIPLGDQLRAAWEDFLMAECARAPVVLVVEDLQWADRPSVELIDRALRNFGQRQWMVLAVGRPEHAVTFPKLWRSRGVREVHVGPLKPRAAERLVRAALGARLPAERGQAIIERASGNAYFLEELIRAEAEGRGGELPETVVAMVEARLLRLDTEVRRVLRAASVFGAQVDARGVSALLDGAPVAKSLEALTREELLAALISGGFAFRQVAVREAAYALLVDEDRTSGHARAADFLVASGEKDAAKVAEHFERGGRRAEAAQWWATATEQALEGNDFTGCIARAERARACGAEGDALARALVGKVAAHQHLGEVAPMREAAEAAAAVVGASADVRARVIRSVVAAALRAGDMAPLQACVDEAVAALGESPSNEAVVAGATVATICVVAGQTQLAKGLFEALTRLAADGTARSADCRARLLQLGKFRAIYAGDYEAYRESFQPLLDAFAEAGDARGVSNEHANFGCCVLRLGANAEAETKLRAALEDVTRLGLTAGSAFARLELGLSLARLGTVAEAEELERAALAHFVAGGDVRYEVFSRIYLSLTLQLAKRPVEAVEEARRACERLPVTHLLGRDAAAALADALLATGDEAARAEALALARSAQGESSELPSLVRRVYLDALEANGLHEEARVAREAARAWVLERAAKIRDPHYRHTFLHDEPDNARILGARRTSDALNS